MEKEKNTIISNRVRKNIIIHPWLLALAPIISLYDHNKDVTEFHYVLRPITIALILITIFLLTINIFIQDYRRSALTSSLWIVAFFLFAYFAKLFTWISPWVDYNLLALVIFLIFLVSLSIIIASTKKSLNEITKIANLFAAIVLLIPAISASIYNLKTPTNVSLNQQTNENVVARPDAPDIYYIILDAYGRNDILQEMYNYDNSSFTKFLTDHGFYVASQSYANYPQTFLSLGSSFNMDYLDNLEVKFDPQSQDRMAIRRVIENNKVYNFLKSQGYTTVTWTGSYQMVKADLKINYPLASSEFEDLIRDTTPIGLFIDPYHKLNLYKQKFLYLFDHLPDISQIPEPTFSYIHILSPHPPFIFDASGNIDKNNDCVAGKDGSHYYELCPGVDRYRKNYIQQLIFLNKKVEETISQILANSPEDPIIILQADHGPGSSLDWNNLENTRLQERFPILNAYYVPETIKSQLYPKISPVNSFRLIFNTVFTTKFELLEDKSYFAIWKYPYQFTDVTNQLK